MRGQADGGRGIALRGFGQDLALRNLGQLPHDLGAQMIVGENPMVLRRDHRAQPVHSLLDQRSLPKEAQHLLGVRAPAARPEARTSATGQDQAVVIRWARHQLLG